MTLRPALVILSFVASLSGSVQSQPTGTTDFRQIVGISKLTSSSNEAAERFLPLVTERLVDVVEGTNRFRLIDLTSEVARQAAIEAAKDNYRADNAFNVTDNSSLVAEYILTADVGSLRFLKQKERGNDVYKADLVMTLKLLDTSTGTNVYSETFTSSRSVTAISPERAVSNAFDTVQDIIRQSVIANFPIVTGIARIREESDGKAVSVLLFGGTGMSVEIGQKMNAYVLDETLSPPLEETVGSITITGNLDSRYSSASVDAGGEKILELFRKGVTVRLRSKPPSTRR
jgi:hypothetical protein